MAGFNYLEPQCSSNSNSSKLTAANQLGWAGWQWGIPGGWAVHSGSFVEFLSKNHTRQITILVNNEYTIRKNKGIFIVSIFEIDIIKVPLFFLIFQLLVPKIDICLFGQKFLKTATVLYCASARTDRQWPRNISLRSVNLPKKARADCSSSFQLWCALYIVEKVYDYVQSVYCHIVYKVSLCE